MKTRKFEGYYLTEEQNHGVDLALTCEDLKIEAFAGSGKTTELNAIAHFKENERGLYIAFNKSIQTYASDKFPSSVTCKTTHSLAYADMIDYFGGFKQFNERLKKRLNGKMVADILNISDIKVGDLSRAAIGNLILDFVTKFTQSAEKSIKSKHAPFSSLKIIENEQLKQTIIKYLLPLTKKLWKKMIDQDGTIPITHDVYLKLWAISEPQLNFDYILFDECQDANPVILDLVQKQNCQQIYVGDRFQQIYSWRGAVNAMDIIKTKHTAHISQSFRFGQEIADLANKILNENLNANVKIKGFEKIKSKIDYCEPDAILCRTNGKLIENLIKNVGNGRRVFVAGGVGSLISLLKGAKSLISGYTTNQPDLCLFKEWQEVVEFSETDAGTDLKVLVKLVDKYDIDQLVETLEDTKYVRADNADLVLSTVHKAKGLEWNNVYLENDFKHKKSNIFSAEEVNILYVALTRAKKIINIEDCEAVLRVLHPENYDDEPEKKQKNYENDAMSL